MTKIEPVTSIKLKRYVLNVLFNASEFWEFIQKTHLKGRYIPIFSSTAKKWSEEFQIDVNYGDLYSKIVPEIGVSRISGELFFNPQQRRGRISTTELFRDSNFPNTFVKVYFTPRLPENKEYARVMVNALSSTQEHATQSAKDMLNLICGFKKTKVENALVYEDFDEYARIAAEEISPFAEREPVDLEMEKSAELLRKSANRELLRTLQKRGPTLSSDLRLLISAKHSKKDVKRLSNELAKAGLLDTKYAVVCSSTSDLLLSADDKKEVEDLMNTDITCGKCNKQLKNERVEEMYSVSDMGSQCIEGSKWMTFSVRKCLLDNGCKPECVFHNVKVGEDELDLLVFFWGKGLAFELKDRNFELGDVYKFNSKCFKFDTVFPARHIKKKVVITTGIVNEQVKDWIPEIQKEAWRFIERCDDCLEPEIRKLLEEVLVARSYYILKGKEAPLKSHLWALWSQLLTRKFAGATRFREQYEESLKESLQEELSEED